MWRGTGHPFITPSESVGNSTAGDKLHNTLSLVMATRSRIGIELKDGSILSAYHHWDGYPQ